MELTQQERKQLLKLQQGELDAVLLYRKLAEQTKNPKDKETLLEIAADEGKHSAMARKYTGENLKQGTKLAAIITFVSKVIGLNRTFKLLAKAEFMAKATLTPLVSKFPEFDEIIADEEKHGKLLSSMVK